MKCLNRRQFLGQSAAVLGAIATASTPFASETSAGKRSCTDKVVLGRSGVKVTRLGCGTGTNGGAIQRELGQKEFTRMIRHAYDNGIRFFDTADSYDGMHEMLAEALKGIDRSTYAIQTKMRLHDGASPMKDTDRFRKELNSDYFDSFLLHCMQAPDWTTSQHKLMDELEEAKQKKIVLSHGASCHGLKALKDMPGCEWLDVALLRVNHDGTHMDGPEGTWAEPGSHDEAVAEIKKIHTSGTGVVGMKLIGNGDFTKPERREASIRYVMSLDCVDASVIGFKSTAEIDEAMRLMDTYLNV